MKHIPARVPEDAAIRFFNRRRFSNGYGLLQSADGIVRAGNAHSRTPPFLERIWMPFYIIDFCVTSRRGPGTISVSIEAWSGAFAVFQMHENLIEGPIEEEALPPGMSEEEAIASGRRDLLQTIMRRRGQEGKPVIEDVIGVDLFHYPFWVCYRRKGGRINLDGQDALTGERAGNRNRAGILNAFAGGARD